MKKFEYKFIKLPMVKLKMFTRKDFNDERIPELDSSFNDLGKEGFELVGIYWMEGLALFKKEIEEY